MRAIVFRETGRPLVLEELPVPEPGASDVLLRVRACAVCRTDLHIVDGELAEPKLPLVPGHEVVGVVEAVGSEVAGVAPGDRVGVPWLGWTCMACEYCRSGRENLCDRALFTGYTRDGGYAEYAVADHRFCFPIPDAYSDRAAAPLLCAGLIGYRTLRLADASLPAEARTIGLYGFGAAAHLVAQLIVHRGGRVFAFTRPGDEAGKAFAYAHGASWAGGSDEAPPEPLDAALLFAPVGALVPAALRHVKKGGAVVCGGIHMSDVPSFPYRDLWEERLIRSVANLTREDGRRFFEVAPEVPVRTSTTAYPLEDANRALDDLRAGRLEGAAVLEIPET
ncbi:MAG TPA: zinc-dependent alcohol dehydrogenase family protein [Thermoanaerobaculia bacterium]|nr:zinc-dependent alcohol dehydrogenase family protein [Thermoanaerobaculia bacterium]